MIALRDPFAIVHKKDIKNKQGDVVAQVDYVGWSQVADRLDDVDPSWSFSVVQLGEDWCLGRLVIAGRTFENVGYAENADTSWKKEILKDAVSDAFKRCAALAGVARYLYDKDAPHSSAVRGSSSPRPAAPAPRPVPTPPVQGGDIPEEPDYLRDAERIFSDVSMQSPRQLEALQRDAFCPDHQLGWVLKPGGVSKATGKAYDAFWACPHAGQPYCKQKPSKAWAAAQERA